MLRTSSTPIRASAGVSPVSTSSSSSSFGSVASARATSSRRFSDGIRSPASTSARGESAEFQHLLRLAARIASRWCGSGADHDVVDHRHRLETLHHLEGARDAARAALRRRQLGDVLAGEQDRALRRRQHAGDDVEQRRLAGAVRADQTDDFAAPDRNRDVAVRDEAAESLPDVVGFEQARVIAPPPCAGATARRSLPGLPARSARSAAVDDEVDAAAGAADEGSREFRERDENDRADTGPHSVPTPPSTAGSAISSENWKPITLSGSM